MASILIIESHPILREALRRFLFPEHQTVVRERWSGSSNPEGCDLVIVDHETLRNQGDADELHRTLQRLGIPGVWLHQGAPPSLKPGGLAATVAKPLEGAALEAAMQSLLEGRRPRTPAASRPAPDTPPPEQGRPGGGTIELAEVVDEVDSRESDEATRERSAKP